MKRYLFFLLVIFLNCTSVNDYYFGRVTDENNNPLENVIVLEEGFENQTKTDENGYFKLNCTPDWLSSLIFSKQGFKTDTIPTVYIQSGETINYAFIEKKDTTIIQLKILN
ncbi:MAG: carboxypeptidase-like regulatory domain-containing protein [Flavobacteriaceae bacterium]